MATVQIYRDAPVIANKVRPYGSLTSNGDPLTGKYDVITFVFGGPVDTQNPELKVLSLSSRRGLRLRNNWVRTEWQTAF